MRVTLSLQVGRRLLYDTRSTETRHAVVGAKQSGDVEVHLVANGRSRTITIEGSSKVIA